MSGISFVFNSSSQPTDPKAAWKSRDAKSNNNNSSPKNNLLQMVAKINNLGAWNQVQVAAFGSIIPSPPNEWIVTASVTDEQLALIRSLAFVSIVKCGRSIGPVSAVELMLGCNHVDDI